ncbi:spindle assembly abnormal 4 isoform X2 [Rhynchophorus ferrugineus]|uniref:spindle assembly abnormal 4 isoform X2 n=1 Tax=Rhynchophorus ferrugineus TaxID=354439 RepID=UPI003FCEAACD
MMSYSPSASLIRLQELKLWQNSFEDHLDKSSHFIKNNAITESIFNTSENVIMKDWDKRKISPSKQPFEQLIEEKLAEDQFVQISNKPKKPFLKKGEGLARFKMSVIPPKVRGGLGKHIQRPANIKTNKVHLPANSPFGGKKDFIKHRGTWKTILDNASRSPENHIANIDNSLSKTNDNKPENFRRSLDFTEVNDIRAFANKNYEKFDINEDVRNKENKQNQSPSSSNFGNLNKSIMNKIKEYAKKRFSKEKLFSNDIPEYLTDVITSPSKKEPGNYTLEEQKLERELKNFEALEKRVENSSFCSTNTSIVNLLASTPRRNEETRESDKNIIFVNDQQESIELKLKQITHKTDVLRNFLVNLHNMDSNDYCNGTVSSGQFTSAATSFSEEDTRWSTRSPSIVDNYTECDSDPSTNWLKIDAGVNTSFESHKLDETIKNNEPCKDCQELRSKISQKAINFTNLQNDNGKLRLKLKDVEEKYDDLRRQLKNNEIKYMEKIEKLEEDLEIERKKYSKEKTYFENYVKDAQNRPNKREREEITQLKQELADSKELLRLKDTKNGATQARLRTQIKQQEKEISEMKITIEKLQKENAKLNLNQKYMRRPTEVKMLQEINKNLTKLTEETFKNKLNKSDRGDGHEGHAQKKGKDQNCSDWDNKENKSFKNKETERKSSTKCQNRDSIRNESTEIEFSTAGNISLEKKYEHEFGNFSSPSNNCSSSVDKTEKVLSDGSIEISYSNGNLKKISSDGQIIKIQYFNGDTKETNLKDNIIKYHYAATDSLHIQYPDGSEVLEYPEGQKCRKYPDGRTEVSYSDGSLRIIFSDGTEEQQFPDGRKTMKNINGDQTIFLPNGQKEMHTSEYKRREYPDGTVRTLYKDGTVETIYSNGRVRLKDSSGTLIMDTHQEL